MSELKLVALHEAHAAIVSMPQGEPAFWLRVTRQGIYLTAEKVVLAEDLKEILAELLAYRDNRVGQYLGDAIQKLRTLVGE